MQSKCVLKCVLFALLTGLTVSKHLNKKIKKYSVKNQEQEGLKIVIEDGVLQGTKIKSETIEYNAYLGIPYAKPPLGNLRFKPPVPVQKWNGILQATENKSKCIQNEGFDVVGSEDCLYINVYTPNSITSNANLPVMVYIYGGGFVNGDSSFKLINPEYFIEQNVIFVSFNYRLGIFGFIATGDVVAPGNYGLKDQVFVLQWVKNNIKNFGGDIQKITIFGESAGSASVSYLTQIKKAEGLFQNAIMQSGTTLCPWALSQTIKETVVSIASTMFVDTSTSQSMVDGLREKDAVSLQQIANTIAVTKFFLSDTLGLIFVPVIEPDVEEAIITQSSFEILSKGYFHRIPYIIGLNSQEMAAIINNNFPHVIHSYLLTIDLNKEKLIPSDLHPVKSDISKVTKIIDNYYFDGKVIALSPNEMMQYSSDKFFVYPIYKSANLISKYSPVYFYLFDYEGNLGNSNRKVSGVGHAEDLFYLFKTKPKNKIDNKDYITSSRLVSMWTNFAKYGTPTVQGKDEKLLQNITWPTTNTSINEFTYLNIAEDLMLKYYLSERAVSFWDFIYTSFGKKPYTTL